VNVREPIVALGALDSTLPVVAELVETGESIPIDVVVVAGLIYEDEPAHDDCGPSAVGGLAGGLRLPRRCQEPVVLSVHEQGKAQP